MAKLRRKYSILWAVWLTSFLTIEGFALIDRDTGDTLSEHVWFFARNSFVWWTLAGFLTWVVVHFLGPSARRWINTWRKP
jgi:hypothetical protein